jgi:hypothetical protein
VFAGHRTSHSGTQKNIIQLQEKRGGRLNRTCNTRAQKQLLMQKMREKGLWMTEKMMGILKTEQESDFYHKNK